MLAMLPATLFGAVLAQAQTNRQSLAQADPMSGAPGGTGISIRPAAELPDTERAESSDVLPAAAAGTMAVVSASTNFDRYGTQLDDTGLQALAELSAQLAGFSHVISIRVVGHADARGPEVENQQLSEQRADYVASILRSDYPNARFVTLGRGEAEPIADNETIDGRARNRRTEIQVIAISSNH